MWPNGGEILSLLCQQHHISCLLILSLLLLSLLLAVVISGPASAVFCQLAHTPYQPRCSAPSRSLARSLSNVLCLAAVGWLALQGLCMGPPSPVWLHHTNTRARAWVHTSASVNSTNSRWGRPCCNLLIGVCSCVCVSDYAKEVAHSDEWTSRSSKQAGDDVLRARLQHLRGETTSWSHSLACLTPHKSIVCSPRVRGIRPNCANAFVFVNNHTVKKRRRKKVSQNVGDAGFLCPRNACNLSRSDPQWTNIDGAFRFSCSSAPAANDWSKS